MSRLLLPVLLLAGCSALAATEGLPMDKAEIDRDNVASLQRGARNFMNYCAGCHAAKYVRYKTIGRHLELSEDQLINNLMFNAEKTFETINTTMPEDSAERWFGKVPPDMSLIARSRGEDYIYNFLKTFYVDADSPTGVDNLVLANTAMPHVLWELQGYQRALFTEHVEDGVTTTEFAGFETATEGALDPEEYDVFVRDTVNFLAYIAEPIRSDRRKLGVWVLMFLTVFLILAWMLKKQIWKDIT